MMLRSMLSLPMVRRDLARIAWPSLAARPLKAARSTRLRDLASRSLVTSTLLLATLGQVLGIGLSQAVAAPNEGKQYDSSGRYQGRIDKDGKVYDASGRYQGRTDKDGRMYDASGRYTGRVEEDGRRYDASGRYQGRSDKDGRIYDASGRYEGKVGADGKQYDASGRYEGRRDSKATGASSGAGNASNGSASSTNARDVTHFPAGSQAVQVENHRQIAPGVFCRADEPGCGKGKD